MKKYCIIIVLVALLVAALSDRYYGYYARDIGGPVGITLRHAGGRLPDGFPDQTAQFRD